MSGKNYALALAVLLLGLALGGEIVRRLPARARADSSAAVRAYSSIRQMAPSEYDHLVGLLGLPAGSAAAGRVIRELRTSRRLQERWESIVRQNPAESRGALLEELADDESFEALLNRLKGDPEFEKELEPARLEAKRLAERAAGASEAIAPDGSRMLVEDSEPLRRGLTPGRLARPALRGPQVRGGRFSLAKDPRGAPSAGPVGQTRVVGPSTGVGSFRPVGEPERTVTYRPGAAAAERGPASAAERANAGQGPDAHEVRAKLATISAASSPQMARLLEQYPWLANLTDAERADIFRYTGEDGLWGACFRLGIYQRCANACTQAGASCVLLDGWRACLDYQNGNTATCMTLCAQQPGCTPPGGPNPGGPPGGTPGGACPYAGQTCEQICSPFELLGTFACNSPQCFNQGDDPNCSGSCARWNRSCPGDSRCDTSVRQNPGGGPSSGSTPCP